MHRIKKPARLGFAAALLALLALLLTPLALGMQSAVERAHMEDRAVLMAWQAVTRM